MAHSTGIWEKWAVFACLLITTTLSILVVVAWFGGGTISGSIYDDVVSNRATYQLAIQLLASILGLIHASVLCRLVNYAARLRLVGATSPQPVRMDTLRTWVYMSVPNWSFTVPFALYVPLMIISGSALVSTALWVGALTPVAESTVVAGMLRIPSFANTSLIREYPSEVRGTGPTVFTRDGLFSYSVGVKFLGSLVASAASATTADGSVRKHPKLDNTQFSYEGRSYGVGSSIGLSNAGLLSETGEESGLPRAARYTFTEVGYLANVSCLYNSSTDFRIGDETSPRIYAVSGYLPDSLDGPEFSEYVGHGPDTIVAMGVAFSGLSPRRYVAIAAGANYAALNTMQCAIDFTPTTFSVTVGITSRNISVVRLGDAAEFDATRILTRTLMRQFELITNDMTNIYVSIVGDSLMSSVAALTASRNGSTPADDRNATLVGVENALAAMTDDMLGAYAAAQLMVGNNFATVPADVRVSVLVIGQLPYIIAILVINVVVVVLFVEELIRTAGWRRLPVFDFSDPNHLISASFNGGRRAVATEGPPIPRSGSEAITGHGYGTDKQLATDTQWGELRDQSERSLVELRTGLNSNGETALVILKTHRG